MLFIANVAIRINDGYSDKGETIKRIHTVEAVDEAQARYKIEKFYKQKDQPYSLHHDIIELELSEHIDV